MARFQALVDPDDWDRVRSAIERSARNGEPVHVDYRILAGDGGVRWISSRGRPQLTSSGESERLMGVSIDITERKRGEESLRVSEARLAAGADLAGLGFYEGDFAEGKMYVDDRMRQLAGIPPERTAGLQALEFWLEHLHPDDRPRVLNLRDQLHDGRLDRFSSSIVSSTRPVGRSGSSTWRAPALATPPDARSAPSAFSATLPSASGSRTSCAT